MLARVLCWGRGCGGHSSSASLDAGVVAVVVAGVVPVAGEGEGGSSGGRWGWEGPACPPTVWGPAMQTPAQNLWGPPGVVFSCVLEEAGSNIYCHMKLTR